jgi:hypothetical protein
MVSASEKSPSRFAAAERIYKGLVGEFALLLFGVPVIEQKKKRTRSPKKRPIVQIAERRAAIDHHKYRLGVLQEAFDIGIHPELFTDIFVDDGGILGGKKAKIRGQMRFDTDAIAAQYEKIEPLRRAAIRELSAKTPNSYIRSRHKKA